MGSNELPRFEKKETPENVRVAVDSELEAAKIVEEFWRAMPHGQDMVRELELDEKPDWSQQLTFGDRTSVRAGVVRGERGKFVISFSGNHQPLSHEAVKWLKEKGYTS